MIEMKKILALGVIFLFIGVSIAPSINFTVVKASNDNDLVEVTTQTCGISNKLPRNFFIKKLNGVMGASWCPYLDVMTGYCITNSEMNIGRFVIKFPFDNPFNESGKGFFVGPFFFGRFGAIIQYNLSIPWIPGIGYGEINETHFYWTFWTVGQRLFEHSYYFIYGNVSDVR